MKTKIWLDTSTGRRAIVGQPAPTFATFSGACPCCRAVPFRVAGEGQEREGHDTYAARARCIDCDKHVGTVHARVDTIFGIEEDERVLHGRCRVY